MISQLSSPFGDDKKGLLKRYHLDGFLLLSLLVLSSIGLVILYSATNGSNTMMMKQGSRLFLSLTTLFIFAQIPPHKYQVWTPMIFIPGVLSLVLVLLIGRIGNGAQRWLDFGFFHVQPSEVMKVATPMMVAWYLNQAIIPIDFKTTLKALALILIPTFLIVKQPDLGTALMVAFSGVIVLFFAGLSRRFIATTLLGSVMMAPFLWHMLHGYQKRRVLTFLNPERDPLGSGYHIIQSKIAIGSGGLIGKGWLQGTQSHLHFLPEHATDFIFAVIGEEFGLIGCAVLITVFTIILLRCIFIAQSAGNTFCRLLAISLTANFFISAFVNMGMVTGLLPVVGIPLPLVSYGGSSMIVFYASFGIIMSIYSHRNLFDKHL